MLCVKRNNFMKSLEKNYHDHHMLKRRPGFAIFGEERGKFLKNRIGEGKSVLDIGCRDGALTKYYYKSNDVLGVDIDGEALKRAEDNLGIKTQKIDLNGEWNLPENYFDVIIAAEVIEHLYFPENVIKKIVFHLKDNGIFLGSVPNAYSLKNRLRYFFGKKKNTPLEDLTHINHFSYGELKNLLEKNFKEVEITGFGKFKLLSKLMPSLFAFSLFFEGKLINKKNGNL